MNTFSPLTPVFLLSPQAADLPALLTDLPAQCGVLEPGYDLAGGDLHICTGAGKECDLCGYTNVASPAGKQASVHSAVHSRGSLAY